MGQGAGQTEAQGYECVAVAKRSGWVCRDYFSPEKGFQVLFLEKPDESSTENQHFVTCHEECWCIFGPANTSW